MGCAGAAGDRDGNGECGDRRAVISVVGQRGDIMSQDLISVIDVAHRHHKKKSTVFKVLKRLGITPHKRRDSCSGNQFVAYITIAESERVGQELLAGANRLPQVSVHNQGSDEFVSAEIGVFYLIQLESDHDPGRFKVGFAANRSERLRALRCSAPFSAVLQQWPCRRLWEKTAIDCVSAGCEQLHTEVFRTAFLEDVIARCQQFFDLMPSMAGIDRSDEAPISETEHPDCLKVTAAGRQRRPVLLRGRQPARHRTGCQGRSAQRQFQS
jgi:hypothetical protein